MNNKEAIGVLTYHLLHWECLLQDGICSEKEGKETIESLKIAIKALEEQERPTGKWIYTDKEDKTKGYGGYCSNCKCDMPMFFEDWKEIYVETDFCPNCGARMEA